MASELAIVAVDNERWHHSAASRALAEQLDPRRRTSLVTSCVPAREGPRRYSRAVSSFELASIPSHPSDLSLNREETTEPGMAHSSGSDSSSDNEDTLQDKEECEEWAAELIADLTEHQMLPIHRSVRSASVTSEDSSIDGSTNSGSVKGFWVIPPGSSVIAPDDRSIEWSPKATPRESVDFVANLEPPFLLGKKGKENGEKDPKTQTVSFSSSFLPPAIVNVTGCKTPGLTNGDFSDVQKTGTGGMTRSKSYTALSAIAGRVAKAVTTSVRHPNQFSEEYEHFRKYFHKFIDLVIVRETTAALHHSKHAAVKITDT